MVVFVLEDVASSKLRDETLDGVTDGLQFFPSNVMFFVLGALKSSSLEALGQNRSPSVVRAVRV
jgi:hypothetical protein